MNDPREMAIRPESGVTLEQDNRVETMYHWGAMITDLCDMPVSEYMKPMTVIVYGNNGDYEEPDYPGTTLKTEEVKIWFRVLKNGNEITEDTETIYAAGDDSTTVWTACWEWTGSFSNRIRVAAVVETENNVYNIFADLEDNDSKKYTQEIEEANGDTVLQSYKSYGVDSVDTPVEEVTGTTYTEIVEEENKKYEFEISSAETIVYLTLKLVGVTSYTNSMMRYQDEIPFDKVNIEKEGYDFIGWFDSNGKLFEENKMPAKNLTLTAKYEVKKCNVSFIFVIDGEEEVVSTTTVKYGSKVSKFPSTTINGYDFKGWEPSTSTVIKEDTEFRAVFESKKYTVTWVGYADGPITQEYKYGELLIEPIAPEKEGYTFVKWDKTLPETVVTNLKFTAQFKVNQYKIFYVSEWNGETQDLSAVTKNYNTTIILPKVPTEKGYTYSEWQSDYTGTTMPAYDVEYKTIKTANAYILAYYDNGELIKEEEYDYMERIIPFTYIKEGYSVSDWENLPEIMPYNNVSAYCTTEILRYTVEFIDQNGNLIQLSENVPYGTIVSELLPKAPEGYSYNIEYDINSIVKSDLTISVEKVINEYDVTINGEIVKLQYNTDIVEYVKNEYSVDEGYYIDFITLTHQTVPADDSAVVVFEIKPNIWVLSYSTEGCDENVVNETINVAYGTNILSVLPSTDVEGYIFVGWYYNDTEITEDSTMPNNNITIIGRYKKEVFEVRVVDGNMVIFDTICEYKTTLNSILSNDVVKDYVLTESANGYTVVFTLNGKEVDENMEVKENLDIIVEKEPNTYVIIFKNGENIISTETKKFGEIIVYPVVENKIENDIEYIFQWNNNSYNGQPMPNMNLEISGEYVEKSVGEIYFGSFVVEKQNASTENLVQYYNETDLQNGVYNSVKVNDCIGVYNPFTLIVPPYEPFVGVEDFIVDEMRNDYYAALTLIVPVNVIDKYSISLKDDLVDYWEDYITDKKIINVNGVDCYFFVRYSEQVTPYFAEQYLGFYLKLTEKKQYNLTFKNGEEIISTSLKYEGEIIEYPVVENKEEDGNVYVFVWEDMTYNGKPMPSFDVVINGSYQMKEKDPIYYGSFVVEKSQASTTDLIQYFDESQLQGESYNQLEVDSCIEKNCEFNYLIPPYEPFKGLPDFVVDEMRNDYYAALTLIIPKDIYDSYTPSIVDDIGVDYWSDYIVDQNVIKINGSDFVFCVRYSEQVTPYLVEQIPGFKFKLTKK